MSAVDSAALRSVLASQLEYMDGDTLRTLLQSQLQKLSPQAREEAAGKVAEKVRTTLALAHIPELPPLPAAEEGRLKRHLQEMQTNGITLLGPVLSPKMLEEAKAHLKQKSVYASHVWAFSNHVGRNRDELKKTHRQACYELKDILTAPHLLEVISNPFVLKLAEQYLGVTPTVYQSNLMWSFAQKGKTPAVAQAFHRDWDNFRFCVLFIYMTDVDKNTGPHQFIRKTHLVKGAEDAAARYSKQGGNVTAEDLYIDYKGTSIGDAEIKRIFGDDILEIEAPAGYAFLADAFALHRGLPLLDGERLLFWTRFGLYDNGHSVDVTPAPLPPAVATGRVPDNATMRYIFRAMVQSEFSEPPQSSLHPNFEDSANDLITRFGRKRFVREAGKLLWQRMAGKRKA